MIGTHSIKAFDATIKQDGVCADIISSHSNNFISSQTVKMRRKYFAIPRNAAELKLFIDEARQMEPWKAVGDPVLPAITSSRVKQILLPYRGDYVSASPVGSCGVLHEVHNRLYESHGSQTSWTVQPNLSSLGNHGEALVLQRGKVNSCARRRLNSGITKWKGCYVQLTARLERCVMNSGMIATGFPAITAVGGAVHTLERATNQKIDFALAVKNSTWHSGVPKIINIRDPRKPVPAYYATEHLGTFDITLILRTSEALESLAEAARKLTRLAGGLLFNISVTIHRDSSPEAGAFITDCSDEVELFCTENRFSDPLSAALRHINEEFSFYSLIHSGYAFLEYPVKKELARNNYPHAWSEPVFSLFCTGGLSERAFWRRSEQDGGVYWIRN